MFHDGLILLQLHTEQHISSVPMSYEIWVVGWVQSVQFLSYLPQPIQEPHQPFWCLSYVYLLLMAEILHQLMGNLSHYLQGFIHPRWLAGFLPSTVWPWYSHVWICFCHDHPTSNLYRSYNQQWLHCMRYKIVLQLVAPQGDSLMHSTCCPRKVHRSTVEPISFHNKKPEKSSIISSPKLRRKNTSKYTIPINKK